MSNQGLTTSERESIVDGCAQMIATEVEQDEIAASLAAPRNDSGESKTEVENFIDHVWVLLHPEARGRDVDADTVWDELVDRLVELQWENQRLRQAKVQEITAYTEEAYTKNRIAMTGGAKPKQAGLF